MILYLSIVLSLTHCRRFQVSGAWGSTWIQESGKKREPLPNPSRPVGPNSALMDTAYLLLTQGLRFDSLLELTYGYAATERAKGVQDWAAVGAGAHDTQRPYDKSSWR
jgi:hypothetical protein